MKNLVVIFILFTSYISKGAVHDLYFPTLIKLEGVIFTVTEYDLGGATKFGVTLKTFKQYASYSRKNFLACDKNKDGRITRKDLSRTCLLDIKPIYKIMFWDIAKCDSLKSQAVAEMITDLFVNSGKGYDFRHVKFYQRCVGTATDGKIGAKTVKAVNTFNSHSLFRSLYVYRANFYRQIVSKNRSQKVFLKGWYRRLNILKSIHNETFT
jgi:lysozyme family protein